MLSAMTLGMAGGVAAQTQLGYSAVLDFNNDGLADIVDHHAPSGQFWIRLNLGNGTFAPAGTNWGSGTTSAPGGTWRILTGNFHSIAPGYTDYVDWHLPSGSAWLHTSNNNGTFNPTGGSFPPLGGMPTNPDIELLVAPRFFSEHLLIEHNRVTGVLRFRYPGAFVPGNFSSFATQTGSDWRIALCDFGGTWDYADLVEYHIPSAQFWVHEMINGSDFNPVASIAWTAFSHPSFTTIFGDYNGDRLCDYADLNKVTGEFWVHLNQGNGTFAAGNYAYGVYTASPGFGILGLPITF